MKKTININLANRNFYIEEDAYKLIDEYIRGVKEYYRADDPDGEIAEDFEIRLGELLNEKKKLGHEVVTLDLAQEVITQIGRIEDLDEPLETSDDGQSEFKGSQRQEKKSEQRAEETSQAGKVEQVLTKKLFRDPKNKILGGVIAGIAANLNVDASLLRLVYFLFLFTPLNWIMVLLYIIAWACVPKAETATDRLRMEGKPLNSENLWKSISKDNPEVRISEIKSEPKEASGREEETKTKKRNNIVWWIFAALLLIGVIATLIWLISSIDNGFIFDYDIDDYLGYNTQTGWIIFLGLVLAFFCLLFVVLLVAGIFFVVYVFPISLIIKSTSLPGGVKALLICMWIILTFFWVLFFV